MNTQGLFLLQKISVYKTAAKYFIFLQVKPFLNQLFTNTLNMQVPYSRKEDFKELKPSERVYDDLLIC